MRLQCSQAATKMAQLLMESGVESSLEAEVERVDRGSDTALRVYYWHNDQQHCITAYEVFNCTYARMNYLLAKSDLPLIPLKHELAELALVEVPDALKRIGVTIMCGHFSRLCLFLLSSSIPLATYVIRLTVNGTQMRRLSRIRTNYLRPFPSNQTSCECLKTHSVTCHFFKKAVM